MDWIKATPAVAAILLAGSLSAGPASSRPAYPVKWDAVAATADGAIADVAPPGANMPCRPNLDHPEPVILLHGITQNQNGAWQALAPTLANNGYCVFTLTYGKTGYSANFGGIGPVQGSAAELDTFVSGVLRRTGATKVDLVGYSEGGFIARQYLKTYGQRSIHKYIGVSPVNFRPADISGLLGLLYRIPGASAALGTASPAFEQLSTWPVFNAVNQPTAVFPSIIYTNIATTHDAIATPYQLSFLPGAPNVRNITVQQYCPADTVGHLGMPYDRSTVRLVENALDPSRARPVPCDHGLPM